MAFLFDSTLMETAITDVESTQDSTSQEVAESSPVVETSGESQVGVTTTEEAQTTQTEQDPLEGVPTVEELQQLAAQKVPHSEALARLRPAYEGLKTQFGELQTSYEPWKPVVDAIGDPQLAQSAYELISKIHTPSDANPSRFTSVPFLTDIEEQSPGTINQMFSEMLAFQIQDENGQPTTVVRELYKAHGLNPDRIDDYRNIDNLRASGVVTDEDLTKIPEQYRDAFKALSQAAREDLLDLIDTKPLVAEEQLRNAKRALDSERYEQQETEKTARQAEADRQQFEQQVATAVEEDVVNKIQSWSNSIHQNLSSQWKPSTDEAANSLEYAKILSTLATLQVPAWRFVAENALKSVGVSLEGFDDLITQWQESRSRFVTFSQMKDTWQAKRAESEASRAEQRILLKLNDYALKLAQVGGNRLAAQSQQTANQLAAASSRFVPSGNGNTQQGFTNPYEQITAEFGTPEYAKAIREIDKQYKVTHGSMFNG